jgi:hypothetical protein
VLGWRELLWITPTKTAKDNYNDNDPNNPFAAQPPSNPIISPPRVGFRITNIAYV